MKLHEMNAAPEVVYLYLREQFRSLEPNQMTALESSPDAFISVLARRHDLTFAEARELVELRLGLFPPLTLSKAA